MSIAEDQQRQSDLGLFEFLMGREGEYVPIRVLPQIDGVIVLTGPGYEVSLAKHASAISSVHQCYKNRQKCLAVAEGNWTYEGTGEMERSISATIQALEDTGGVFTVEGTLVDRLNPSDVVRRCVEALYTNGWKGKRVCLVSSPTHLKRTYALVRRLPLRGIEFCGSSPPHDIDVVRMSFGVGALEAAAQIVRIHSDKKNGKSDLCVPDEIYEAALKIVRTVSGV